MEFAEKLNLLFEISGAEGKELAAALNITPPQISKMRKGLRGLPRNRDTARIIARFFARRCNDERQRDALAKAMRIAQVRSISDEVRLAEMLLTWFLNEKFLESYADKGADSFLHRLNLSPTARIPQGSSSSASLRSAPGSVTAFYGIGGKRAAYKLFFTGLLEKKSPFDICVLSDEDNTWIDDDPDYAGRYYEVLLRLTEQGCYFKRIVGPLNSMAQAFYSLNRWYPLYLTGKASSFYYKRMRDELNRVTIFVVQDVAALFSFSVSGLTDADCVCFYTTDTKTVSTMMQLFKKYLAQCEPAMKTYNADSSETQMHERLLQYESYSATCMQLSPSLSFITLPWEVAVALRSGRDARAKDVFLASFAKRYKAFKKNLEENDFFDFIRLADVGDVMDRMVPIPAGNILSDDTQYYTPEAYLQHLKSVEYLLKRHSHYHAIIEPNDAKDEPIIYAKENCAVLVTRANVPFVIFDVTERNLITAFTENMRRRIPEDATDESFRAKTLQSVQALIGSIESRLAEK